MGQAQLRVCISVLEDEADMLEQWLRHAIPSAEAVERRAQVLRYVADVTRRSLLKSP